MVEIAFFKKKKKKKKHSETSLKTNEVHVGCVDF